MPIKGISNFNVNPIQYWREQYQDKGLFYDRYSRAKLQL